ncbi:ABC transporter permease [Arsenicicoccus piscis]|uniref:ABC transporter permease n=1 Tax=Arsenicicoccus piscis TaxID=673954 RepID=A0ABQ6HRV7_9MICO|nr:ABC transporter permease subunit [Arsenicicoccus piscis]MCH8626559.1 ABC transporter permease [Arsenicicoccus piscis]GMA21206.1 ABC transporter permease [Arsenicicoccus piscis]
MSAHRRAPLSLRAETRRQLGRRRTLWIFGILLALPVIFVAAFALDSGRRPNGTRMVDLATGGSANFTIFVLLVSAELLLAIVAALLAGDPVPAEASWASLRYLLTAPVTRARLLTSKLLVGVGSLVAAVLLLAGWSLLVGWVAYGSAGFLVPGGGSIPWSELWPRLLVIVGYLLVSALPVAAIAFWVGVRTDTPLAAVGGAVIVLIVSGILDSIDALGTWRDALLGHYSRAWMDLLAPGPLDAVDWTDLRRGALWATLYTIVFVALGYRRFARKDILS